MATPPDRPAQRGLGPEQSDTPDEALPETPGAEGLPAEPGPPPAAQAPYGADRLRPGGDVDAAARASKP